MTIQSVELKSNKQIKNDSDISLVESGVVSSLGTSSKKFKISSPKKNKSNIGNGNMNKGDKKIEEFDATLQS